MQLQGTFKEFIRISALFSYCIAQFEFLTVWIHYSIFLCLLRKNPFTHKTQENTVWAHFGFFLWRLRKNPFTHKTQKNPKIIIFDFFFSNLFFYDYVLYFKHNLSKVKFISWWKLLINSLILYILCLILSYIFSKILRNDFEIILST